ncbi:GNAT family N-acetyltransferase [Streptomyces sp. MAR4 CNX-425]|uniref:GNAT family N-acetyltransferase n=1 Tax=Streptomyces sp. MAR4 CNX-425 TaxID=3406343 RepID=UPI003B5136E6
MAGTLQLDKYADPEFWVPDDQPEEALYIHRMAVTRSAAGQGVGARMLDCAAQRAAQSGSRYFDSTQGKATQDCSATTESRASLSSAS